MEVLAPMDKRSRLRLLRHRPRPQASCPDLLPTTGRTWSGPLVVGVGVGLFAVTWLVAGVCGITTEFWTWLGVEPLRPVFADLRNITTALDCQRLGYDPLVEDPCDPWGRPMNYPRVWLLLGSLGMGEASTEWLGYGLAAAFFCAAATLAVRLRPWEATVYAGCLLSPAVLLGVERGNNDLVLFILLVAAAAWLSASHRGEGLGWGLVGLSAVLKLYPIVACAVALREPPRRAAAILGGAMVLFGTYLALTLSDVALIRNAVPFDTERSYGYRVVFDWMSEQTARPQRTALAASALFAVGAGSLSAGLCARPLARPSRAFDLGCALYAGTFALGYNWDYRLVFVLLAVPQLIVWSRNTESVRGLPKLIVGAYAVSVWSGFVVAQASGLGDVVLVLEEGANWVLFSGLLVMWGRTQPHPWAWSARAGGRTHARPRERESAGGGSVHARPS